MPKQRYLSRLYAEGSEFVVSKGFFKTPVLTKTDQYNLQRYGAKIIRLLPEKETNYFLEIGVGAGHLFNYMQNQNIICYGVEPGYWKPANPFIFADINDIPKHMKFDIIVIKDVLEHIENPIEMLSILKPLASERCVIICGFPNKDAIKASFLKSRWAMIRPLGHLHYFSARSARKMFELSGWNVVVLKSVRPAMISALDIVKSFDLRTNARNPIKLFFRFGIIMLKQIVLGKDQWYIQGQCH